MTEYLNSAELAAYLGVDDSPTLDRIAKLTNALIDDEWTDPVDPVPARVANVAWTVAVRAAANPKGLTSWTRSWDDITRTERMEAARRFGIYLTDDERIDLNGEARPTRRAGTIQTTPGLVRSWRC